MDDRPRIDVATLADVVDVRGDVLANGAVALTRRDGQVEAKIAMAAQQLHRRLVDDVLADGCEHLRDADDAHGLALPGEQPSRRLRDHHRVAAVAPHRRGSLLHALADVETGRRPHHVGHPRLREARVRGEDHLEPDGAENLLVAAHKERHRVLRAQWLENVHQRVVRVALGAELRRNGGELRHLPSPGRARDLQSLSASRLRWASRPRASRRPDGAPSGP